MGTQKSILQQALDVTTATLAETPAAATPSTPAPNADIRTILTAVTDKSEDATFLRLKKASYSEVCQIWLQIHEEGHDIFEATRRLQNAGWTVNEFYREFSERG